jgi:hypothetical protein
MPAIIKENVDIKMAQNCLSEVPTKSIFLFKALILSRTSHDQRKCQ